VIASDGISESMDPNNEQFGVERMVGVIGPKRGSTAREILDALVDAAKRHAGSAPQYDDMTVVVVKRVH